MKTALGAALWIALAGALPAAAQSPAPAEVESVTVNASAKTRGQIIGDYVSAANALAPNGQLPRWGDRICPLTSGMSPAYNAFITDRIRALAVQAGVRVAKPGACRVNLMVFVATDTRSALEQLVAASPAMLGMQGMSAKSRRAPVMTRPIQAWYTSATRDLRGRVTPDTTDYNPTLSGDDLVSEASSVEGSRLRAGLESKLTSALIVVDGPKIAGKQLGALADYIAMIALTQAQDLGNCRALSTITNLLAADCPQADTVHEATPADLAYLRALYATNPSLFGRVQQNSIAAAMRRTLATQ